MIEIDPQTVRFALGLFLVFGAAAFYVVVRFVMEP